MTLKDWDRAHRSENLDSSNPVQWSQWVREKVDTARNMNVLQSTVSDAATGEVQVMRRENEALQKSLAALEGREIGVSVNRVIELLQSGEYVDFDVIGCAEADWHGGAGSILDSDRTFDQVHCRM